MNNLSFRNYPSGVLITMTTLFVVSIAVIKSCIKDASIDWQFTGLILLSTSLVTSLFFFINKFAMWKWYLKLLGLTDVRGIYKGTLISSFYIDDDPTKEHIEMNIELEICQNINGIKIFGKVSPKDDTEKTSEFESEWVQLKKLENKKYTLEYRYNNRSNIQHSWHKIYQLTSHTGFASLVFDPKQKSLEGLYFTYENKSNGQLKLMNDEQ